MSITIKDIARLVNVSHTTVSRALNDSPLIKPETKEKIKKIAEAHNYIPNYSAKSLVLSKSYNIGLFFSTLKKGTTASFFHEVIMGVNSIIKDKYSLSVKGIDGYKNFSLLSKRYFDGIIMMSQSSDDDEFVQHVLGEEIPLVVLNRDLNKPQITTIIAEDQTGAFKATEFLINKGHKKIGIIEGKENFRNNQKRKQGFLEAMQKHGLKLNPRWTERGNFDLGTGYMAMRKLLQHEELPTAVFCFNDDMAVGAMKAAYEKGLRIPDDISIMGFDDSGYAPFLNPALTTVKRPIEKISIDGTKKLLDQIENNKILANNTFFIPTELIVRDSVAEV